MLRVREPEPDRTQPERRILFATVRLAVGLLRSDIECPDLYTIFAGKVSDLSIRFVLLVLGRKSLESIEEKLRAI
jgi:hypothetical protein